jgi:hypothetical protein
MSTLLLALACASPSWETARAGCGVDTLSSAAWPATSTDEWAELTLDRACIDTLQDALALATVPPDVPDEGSLEASGLTQAQAGLWMLLAFELGTFGDMRADPDLPGVLAEDLDRLDLAEDTPGGEVLYTFVTGAVAGARVEARASAALDAFTDTLLLPALPSDLLPFGWAGVLVHEAVHAPGGRSHVDCETGRPVLSGADDDWNGAWGAGVWTVAWFERNADASLASAAAHDARVAAIGAFCDGVEVPDAL